MTRRPSAATATRPERLDADTLRDGCRALGLDLAGTQIDALLAYAALLLKWNRVHNLTAIRDADELLTHHLLDSLAIVPAFPAWAPAPAADHPLRVLDVGAGGGLPGIPLAIARPDLQVTLVDAVQKKAAFLTQVALDLRLANVSARHARVESMPGAFEVITSRAFAALADMVGWTRHLLAPGGRWLAMKAHLSAAERAALPPDVEVVAVVPLDVPGLGEVRQLVVLQPKSES